VSRPPVNWPTLRLWLVGSLVPGSTAVVDVVDEAQARLTKQQEAGRSSAAKRSQRVRGAIRQAAGALPLHLPAWPVVVAGRIASNPEKYGLRPGEACDDVIRDEWAALKESSDYAPVVRDTVARST